MTVEYRGYDGRMVDAKDFNLDIQIGDWKIHDEETTWKAAGVAVDCSFGDFSDYVDIAFHTEEIIAKGRAKIVNAAPTKTDAVMLLLEGDGPLTVFKNEYGGASDGNHHGHHQTSTEELDAAMIAEASK